MAGIVNIFRKLKHFLSEDIWRLDIEDFSRAKARSIKYLKVLAERYGMNVFAVDGELIFDDVLSGGSPILSLTVGMGLMSFSRRVGLQGQVGEVEIWGRDEKQHFIKGGATRVTVCGAGDTAAQLATKFKKTSLREYSEYVRTEKECMELAQARGHPGADPRPLH